MNHLQPPNSADLTWLKRLAAALLREPHAADDLVQDTVVAALEADVPVEPARRSWLAAVARRLAARRIRTDVRRARREAHAHRPEDVPNSADLMVRAELAERLAAAARRLPEPFRRTILLRFLDGLDTSEIAAREQRPVDTVRHRMRRGLALLREDLQRQDGDWAARYALLAPIPLTHTATALATPGAAASTQTWVALTWMTMKSKLIGIAAVAAITCGAAWWFSTGASLQPDAGAADPEETVAQGSAAPPTTAVAASSDDPSASLARTAVQSDVPTVEARATTFAGEVVDEEGAPVAGATVFAVAANQSDGLLWQVTTSSDGSFRWPTSARAEASAAVDLGVLASGFLRHLETDAQRDSRVRIVLLRGKTLQGRVVDEFGRSVPELALLAHVAETKLEHVSPSRVLLRARRAQFGGRESKYDQARATTDANGGVTFEGLPSGRLLVRSTDPGWTIESPKDAAADGGFVTWTAKRRLGVQLTVVDEATGVPVELAHAKFRVDMTFADGKTEPYGQWVGSGEGGASFVLGPGCFLPSFEGRIITRAEFYGEVRSGEGEPTKWRAPALEDGAGASGVARVRVRVSAEAAEPIADLPTTTVALDARYQDDMPIRGLLSVDWMARPAGGGALRRGSQTLSRGADGRYRLVVPAGTISLSVHEHGASGSLPDWTGNVYGYAARSVAAMATLTRGAVAAIQRPGDWHGTWYLHASWRPVGEQQWRGSWHHSTEAEELVLAAVKPAEWRFLLRRDSATEGEPLVRTVTLTAGNRTIIDR